MSTWSTVKPKTGNTKMKQIYEVVDMLELPKGEWRLIRLVGPVYSVASHWIEVKSKKDGKTHRFSKPCLAYNPETEELDPDKYCPYCEGTRLTINYYGNAIDRELEETKPSKPRPPKPAEKKRVDLGGEKFHVKTADSKTWTPVRAFRATANLANSIKSLGDLNKVKVKGKFKTFGPSHVVYGFDINIKHDPDAPPANQYSVQKDSRRKLSDKELAYLMQDLRVIRELVEDEDTAKQEWDRIKPNLVIRDKDKKIVQIGFESEDDEPKKKKKGKSKNTDYDDDYDDDYDIEEEDVDEDEFEDKKRSKKKKSAKKTTKKKKRSSDDDDDDIEMPW